MYTKQQLLALNGGQSWY